MDLLVDIGSSNIKWRFLGEDGSIPFPKPIREDFPYFEVDCEQIVAIVKKIIDENNPSRVFISVQMHGYVLLDGDKAVTPYISWRDQRGKDLTPDFNLTAEYGVHLKPQLARRSVQTFRGKFDKLCSLGSFVAYRLTGENISHITDVFALGYYNVCKKSQDVYPFSLPQATYSVQKAGNYNQIEIFVPIGDQQASILGATKGEELNCWILNLGTPGQICTLANGFVSGNYESRPYFNDKTLCTVTGLPAGAVISQYTDDEIKNRLIEEYSNALNKLPKRDYLLVTGGLVKYRKPLIEEVLNAIGVKYIFNYQADAIFGLEIIAKGVN